MLSTKTVIPMEATTLESPADGLPLAVAWMVPDQPPKGIVQIAHGMAEHKERYEAFMTFLVQHGYVAVIHDHRGHGASVRYPEDVGYFYTEDSQVIVEDLYAVSEMIRARYPDLSLTLFAHSMGTLVARNYLKVHDGVLDRLILCGPPTRNPAVGMAIRMARQSIKRKGARYRNLKLNALAFGSANRRFGGTGNWLSSDPKTVEDYRKDPLCGYVFTNNGFLNLFQLLQEAYRSSGWEVTKPDLPIFLIAGEEDPVIQSERKFRALKNFLCRRGYRQVSARLYGKQRHELLLETRREQVYRDILRFLEDPTRRNRSRK